MNLEHGLKLELNQKLMMTPELRQAIAILQLSSLDLSEMIEQEVQENPVLEIVDKDGDESESPEQQEPSGENEPMDDYLNWIDYLNDGMEKKSHSVVDDDQCPFERAVTKNISLHEHLELQLHLAVRDDIHTAVGNYLIGCIDDNGYLCITVTEAAKVLGIPEEVVAEVLSLIQTFDPLGVGACDLKECLLLQFAQQGIKNKLVEAIINEYLPDVAAGRYRSIAEKLACKPHDVQEAVDIIRTFDPKPGREFGNDNASYITPDMTVEKINGKFVITVNDNIVPQLMINPYYRSVAISADNESKKFIEGRLNSAIWLIKSIEQRRHTLYKVMEAIIEMQQDFFESGSKFLRPMTMKQVAEQVEVHESTVSRASANKYVNTPHGMVSLRSFFSSAVHNCIGGQDVASTKVKQKIKELITEEDSSNPFSDQALSDILCQYGIRVSRRTVTKYREQLGITSSAKRKRY